MAYCTICGKEVLVNSSKNRNIYYDILSCPNGCNTNVDIANVIKIKDDIVYSRWLKKLAILSHKENISGGIYHPLSGEYIEDIDKYLYQAGFKI